MTRITRYIPAAVVLLIFVYAAERTDQIPGFLPPAHGHLATFAQLGGVLLAASGAWDASHLDRRYLAASATSVTRFLWGLLRPGVVVTAAAVVATILITAVFVFQGDPGGHPWWSVMPAQLLWLILCLVIGIAMGGSLSARPLLSPILAGCTALLLVFFSRRMPESGAFPYFVFDTSSVWSTTAFAPNTPLAFVSVFMLTAFVGIGMWCVASPRPRLQVPATAAVTVVSLAVTQFVSPETGHLVARESPDDPVCTGAPAPDQGARYCAWPEEKRFVAEADTRWGDYLEAMEALQIPVPAKTFGLHGSGAEQDLDALAAASSADIFMAMTQTLLELDVHQRCPELPERTVVASGTKEELPPGYPLPESAEKLRLWTAVAFGGPEVRDQFAGAEQDSSPELQWLDDEVVGRPLAEQISAARPVAEQVRGTPCGEIA